MNTYAVAGTLVKSTQVGWETTMDTKLLLSIGVEAANGEDAEAFVVGCQLRRPENIGFSVGMVSHILMRP